MPLVCTGSAGEKAKLLLGHVFALKEPKRITHYGEEKKLSYATF
jgi:hypothetical protein